MKGKNSIFFFVLLTVGAAVGIGNIFVFPYLSFNLSAIFFIPYLIALIILGVPLLLLEFSIGQFFDKNVIDLFASIRKWFSSIGWLMVFNAFILASLYAVVLAWHIIYFFVSFGTRWKDNPQNYFFNNILQVSDGFSGFTKFSLPVFIALIVAWVVIFFYIKKGYESIKRSFLITIPILVALLLFFLFYSLTLDNALNGVYSFLKPDFTDLLRLNTWFAAFSLAAISLGLSFGIMHVFASKSGKGFLVANSFIAIMFELIAGILLCFIIFSFLGFLGSKASGMNNLVVSDYGTLLVILSLALPFFYRPTLLSLMFFLMLSIMFVLGAAALAYSVSHVLVHKFKSKHVHAAILVSGLGFLTGLVFAIKPGFRIMNIVVHFIYYNIVIGLLLETLAIGWFFNLDKIASFINQHSKVKLGMIWHFIIKYIIPIILSLILAFQIRIDFVSRYNDYPLWALLLFGVGTVAVPLVVAFLMPQKLFDRG